MTWDEQRNWKHGQYGTGWWEFPRPWLYWWHMFMDGTWFCNCTRSRLMKDEL